MIETFPAFSTSCRSTYLSVAGSSAACLPWGFWYDFLTQPALTSGIVSLPRPIQLHATTLPSSTALRQELKDLVVFG